MVIRVLKKLMFAFIYLTNVIKNNKPFYFLLMCFYSRVQREREDKEQEAERLRAREKEREKERGDAQIEKDETET